MTKKCLENVVNVVIIVITEINMVSNFKKSNELLRKYD